MGSSLIDCRSSGPKVKGGQGLLTLLPTHQGVEQRCPTPGLRLLFPSPEAAPGSSAGRMGTWAQPHWPLPWASPFPSSSEGRSSLVHVSSGPAHQAHVSSGPAHQAHVSSGPCPRERDSRVQHTPSAPSQTPCWPLGRVVTPQQRGSVPSPTRPSLEGRAPDDGQGLRPPGHI